MAVASDHQWVRVEFYGALPLGQAVKDVVPLEVGATLMKAFGFDYVDGLTVVVAEPPPSAPDVILPGAFDKSLPAEVPVTDRPGGKRIGTAHVSKDDEGLSVSMTFPGGVPEFLGVQIREGEVTPMSFGFDREAAPRVMDSLVIPPPSDDGQPGGSL